MISIYTLKTIVKIKLKKYINVNYYGGLAGFFFFTESNNKVHNLSQDVLKTII